MKVCPKCNQSYTDDNLNFCLSDGELLLETESQDAPPTLIMDAPRVTNEGNWGSGFDPGVSQGPANQTNQQIFPQPPVNPAMVISQDKTLPVISLILGISGFVFICCYLGIPLGAAAMITGFFGMSRANSDPQAYGGKELAIIGMILGGTVFVINLVMIFLGILGSIFN